MNFAVDQLVFGPEDVDLARSPLAVDFRNDTYVLGAFNPGLSRLRNGNLLAMVRIAEALRRPIENGCVHAIRFDGGNYVRDAWRLDAVDTSDPRTFTIRGPGPTVMALTSLSWLLPVELSPEGLGIEEVHYDRAIAPAGSWQCYGLEDARISYVEGRWLMTTCSVSPERQSTTLYSSINGLDWEFEGPVLDHQNKDMLIFEGLIGGEYWAQTRPLGDLYFAYPPDSEWRAGPSINLATSPDALHWKPHIHPGIRPTAATRFTARMGGGAPPIRFEDGWLSLWHGVEPNDGIGIYRTYWSILDAKAPGSIIRSGQNPLIEPNAGLTRSLEHLVYLPDVVFTTGIVDAGDHFIVASGEGDLACRITHVPKAVFSV